MRRDRSDHCSLILAAVAWILFSCAQPQNSKIPRIPLPSEARDVQRAAIGQEGLQIAFVIRERYPSLTGLDHYSEWAKSHGWTQVDAALEEVAPGWLSYQLADGTPVRQMSSHWQSPDGQLSLRAVVQYIGGMETQRVFATVSPFFLMTEDSLDPGT